MILVLPLPPSVNNLYLNPRGTHGSRPISSRYRAWRKRATAAMWGQRMEMFDGAVKISIVFEDNGKCDLDNLPKAILDHLVHHKIIVDDSRKYVRELNTKWGEVKGCVLEIQPI